MNDPQAIRSGFRAVLTHPLSFVAEVVSHWAASVAAGSIVFYALLSFLHSLPVSDEDAFLLQGMLPGYTSEAMKHILKGCGPKLVILALIVSISVGLLRWLATSASRSAVLPPLLGDLNQDKEVKEKLSNSPAVTAVLFRLHALRIALTFTTVLANFGVLALAEAKSRVPIIEMNETQGAYSHNAGIFFGIVIVLSGIVMLASSVLDWYLELSPVLAVMRATGVRDAFRDAADLAQRRARQFTTVSLFFGTLRWSLNVSTGLVVFVSLSILLQLPLPLRWTVFLFLLAIWSLVQRFLELSRIAAWGRIVLWDGEKNTFTPPPMLPKKMEIGITHPLLEPPVVPAM